MFGLSRKERLAKYFNRVASAAQDNREWHRVFGNKTFGEIYSKLPARSANFLHSMIEQDYDTNNDPANQGIVITVIAIMISGDSNH